MTPVDIKYGFPLFTKRESTNFIVKTNKLRISDIWAFWDYIIRKFCSRTSKKLPEKEFLLTLLEQAKYFYIAADQAPIKSKPLLYYYSFLNLAKIIINFETFHGKTGEYNHGIETKVNATTTISSAIATIKALSGSTKISVANEFAKAMGDNFAAYPVHLNIKTMLNSCIGIHRSFSETYNTTEYYYRLSEIAMYKHGRKLFSRAKIKNCDDGVMAQLTAAGYNVKKIESDNQTSYFWQEYIDMARNSINRESIYNLSNKLILQGIGSYTNGDEYRMYITTNSSQKLSSASIIYNLMFFFGSITRYPPFLFDDILTEKERWLISEFLKTQPSQFLYLVTSRVIGQEVYKTHTIGG